MKVFGLLEKAQLESLSSDLAGTLTGIIYWHSTEGRAKVGDGTNMVGILANDQKCVFGTNGTAANNVRFQRGANALLQLVTGDDVTVEGTMSTSLAEVDSRLPNFTTVGRPVFGNAGRLIWNTTDGEINQDTGSAWSALSGGGGGGGASVEILENQVHLAKLGSLTPLSTKHSLNEPYIGYTGMLLTLAQDYNTADTTAIKLDNDAVQIDAMNATTGWSAVGVGTVSLDTTNKIEGTGSVKLNATLTGQTGIVKTFTAFSIVSKKFRARVKLDTLANLDWVRLALESSGGNTSNLDIAVGSLIVGWNFLEWNIDDATETGTFLPASVTKIYINFNTSAPQTINMNVDDLITVDKWEIPVPMQIQIYDGTNEQLMSIASGSKGVYTLQATLANNYARASSYAYQRNIAVNAETLEYQYGVFKTGLTGAVVNTHWDISRRYFPTSVAAANMDWSLRFKETKYNVNSFTSTTVIKVASVTDLSGGFKSGDFIWLYQMRSNGEGLDSPENATFGSNAKRLTLSGDGTFAAGEITLTHSGDNSHGSDDTNWFVVRESASFAYFLGTVSANENLVVATPVTLLPVLEEEFAFSDNFNRSNRLLHGDNEWSTSYGEVTGGAKDIYPWAIVSNEARSWFHAHQFGGGRGMHFYMWRNAENYQPTDEIDVTYKYKGYASDLTRISDLYMTLYTSGTGVTGRTLGMSFRIYAQWDTAAYSIRFYKDNVLTASQTVSLTHAIWFKVRCQLSGLMQRMKIWLATDPEPLAWTLEFLNSDISSPGNYLHFDTNLYCGDFPSDAYCWMDDLNIKAGENQYFLSGQVSPLTGNKLVTATKLTRNEVAQNPFVYERNALIT